MKKIIVVGFVYFFVSFCYSQSSCPKNGLCITYFPDTALISEYGYYKDGKKHGTWRKYEVTGKYREVFNYRNGEKDGHYILFDVYGNPTREGFIYKGHYTGVEYQYENGKVYKKWQYLLPYPVDPGKEKFTLKVNETQYDLTTGIERAQGVLLNNKKDSVWRHYDEKGNLKAIENFRNGKRSGISKRFYANKRLAEMASFEDGYFEGTRILLTEAGDTTEYGNYANDKREGFSVTRQTISIRDLNEDPQSFLIYGTYTQGILNGKFTIKYPDGKLAAEENYSMGKLNGHRKLYHPNGNIAYDAEFVNHKVNGKELKYFPNGKLMQVTEYADGVITGRQLSYFESGKVSEEALYENGQIKNLQRLYESGKVREKIRFEKGKPVKKEKFDQKGKKIGN